MDGRIDNQQKYENYKEQAMRLKKAINSCFYLEAIFIEYAIIEDRLESALRHSGVKMGDGKFATLNSKLKKVEDIAREKKSVAHKYFKTELIERVKEWKEERNRLIHALMKQVMTTEGLKNFAEEGRNIVKTLCSITSSYNRKIDKIRRL